MPVTAEKGASNSVLPAEDCFPVTPSDTDELAIEARALLISVGGTLKITTAQGTVRSLTVPAGELRCRVRKVHATGTAATGITALV